MGDHKRQWKANGKRIIGWDLHLNCEIKILLQQVPQAVEACSGYVRAAHSRKRQNKSLKSDAKPSWSLRFHLTKCPIMQHLWLRSIKCISFFYHPVTHLFIFLKPDPLPASTGTHRQSEIGLRKKHLIFGFLSVRTLLSSDVTNLCCQTAASPSWEHLFELRKRKQMTDRKSILMEQTFLLSPCSFYTQHAVLSLRVEMCVPL